MNRRLGVISVGISAGALALSLLLANPGQAGTAGTDVGSRGTCQHAVPTAGSPELTKANKAGNDLVGNDMAASVTESLRADANLDQGNRPVSGLPLGLDQGVIGVLGSARAGLLVVVDEAQISVGEMRARIGRLSPLAQRHVEVTASCRSAGALAKAVTAAADLDWPTLAGSGSVSYYLDPETEQVVIESGPDNAEVQSAVTELHDELGDDLIRLDQGANVSRATRLEDDAPFSGGIRINSAGGSCTGGFTVVRRDNGQRAMVTAGHCSANGVAWNNGAANEFVGTSAGRANYPDYDQEMLINGGGYRPHIEVSGGGDGDPDDRRTVTGAGDPGIAQIICTSGSFSLSMCNWEVKGLDFTFCDVDGCTTHLIRANRTTGTETIIGGDSGSPMYTRPGTNAAIIRGITIAGGFDGQGRPVAYGERYASISGHLGVDVVTAAP